jgi:RNA polymerase sigma factor (sigma-70 family)
MQPDKALIEALKNTQSRRKAFETLVCLYQENIYWHIRRFVNHHHDAHDIIQNVFLKAWQNIDGFRGDSLLQTWLFSIATNESINFLNKRKNMQIVSDEEVEANKKILAIKSEPELDSSEIQLKLQLALQELPQKQKQVFELRYYEEMPYEKMSLLLDTSVGALKASYHIAAKKVEIFLANALNL